VIKRNPKGNAVILVDLYQEYIGRLLVHYPGPGVRGRAFYLGNHFDELKVAQVLEKPFEGEAFCGYENVEHGFSQLEAIIKQDKTDWKAALENVKGYLEAALWMRFHGRSPATAGDFRADLASLAKDWTNHAECILQHEHKDTEHGENRQRIGMFMSEWERMQGTAIACPRYETLPQLSLDKKNGQKPFMKSSVQMLWRAMIPS